MSTDTQYTPQSQAPTSATTPARDWATDCPECEGAGEVDTGAFGTPPGFYTATCPMCKGTGEAPAQAVDETLPDWRRYQGKDVIPDGFGGFLAWRDATMAVVAGYYPAKAREMPRRVGITPAQAAEITRDLAEIGMVA